MWVNYSVGIYMFKVNNRNTRTRCEPIFEPISYLLLLVFLFFTLSSIFNFEKVNPTGYSLYQHTADVTKQ